MLARRDEAGEVRHVDHEHRADRVGDLAEAREVELPRIRRPAGDDELRALLLGDLRERVHVDARVLVAHAVGDDLVELAGEVQPHPVREMAAVIQAHAEELVAGVDHRHHRRRVRGRAAVGLHVGRLRAEQRLRALDRERLDDVDVLAAAVVALAGQALGVLVRQRRALAVHDRLRDEVLGGDHLERRLLTARLRHEDVRDLGIDLGYGLGEVVRSQFGHGPEGISGLSRDRAARRRAA